MTDELRGATPPAGPVTRRHGPLIAVVAVLLLLGAGYGGYLAFGRGTPSHRSATHPAPTAAPAPGGASSSAPGAPVADGGSPAAPPGSAGTGAHTVTYEVTGAGTTMAGLIVYAKNDNFQLATQTAVTLPWQVSIGFPAGSQALYTVSAQVKDGTLTCRVVIDGREVVSHTSSEPGAMVTCSGQV